MQSATMEIELLVYSLYVKCIHFIVELAKQTQKFVEAAVSTKKWIPPQPWVYWAWYESIWALNLIIYEICQKRSFGTGPSPCFDSGIYDVLVVRQSSTAASFAFASLEASQGRLERSHRSIFWFAVSTDGKPNILNYFSLRESLGCW